MEGVGFEGHRGPRTGTWIILDKLEMRAAMLEYNEVPPVKGDKFREGKGWSTRSRGAVNFVIHLLEFIVLAPSQ